MKKILLFIDELGSGGAQRQIVSLAKQLKLKGYNVFLLDYWDNPFYDKELSSLGIPYKHALTKGKLAIIKMFRNFVKQYKPDVVISYMENPSVVACITKASINWKFKLIVSERNTTQDNNWRVWLRFQLFRLADYVVPNSISQHEFIAQYYSFLSSKTHTIQNFVDTNRFSPSSKRVDKQNNNVLRGLVVGRIVEQKNVLRFLEALALLRDRGLKVSFEWYGKPYPQSYYDECVDCVKKNNLEEYITFHSPSNDIVSKYQEADFFVLPSIYEGFPNVLCEAMSCGLPVIAGNVCDNARIMKDGVNGYLFDPYSISDMADKIGKLLMLEKKDLKDMGDRSREIAVNVFSKEKFTNEYVNLIETEA